MRNIVVLALVVFSFEVRARDLDFEISRTPVTVNSEAVLSCSQKASPTDEYQKPSVAGPSFEVSSFAIDWQGVGFITPNMIEVELSSPALAFGIYRCSIGAAELASMLPNAIYSGQRIESTCGVRCGGLTFKPGFGSASLTGTIKFKGNQISAYGVQPVMESQPISVSATEL